MLAQSWQWSHIVKGVLTWVPPLNAWRRSHISTGGTNNPRYCYSVWLRHLVNLYDCGFHIKGARIGELGPGDSIGTGLAALLSGADRYIGLDALPLSADIDLNPVFETIVRLYERKEPIPDDGEFPRIRPRLTSYEFPDSLIDWVGFHQRVESLRAAIKNGVNHGNIIQYQAPWTSISDVAAQSLDLIFSQAVLEYASPLNDVYRAMGVWLKDRAYASHVIDFSAHGLSPFWNGHWAYSNSAWRLARGKREVFLNREPLNSHLAFAKKCGFEILLLAKDCRTDGLGRTELSPQFRLLDNEDLQTRGVVMVLQKREDG